MVDKYCNGCEYLNCSGDKSCDYILATGKMRGCASGYGCKKHTNPPNDDEPAPKSRRGCWDTRLAFELFRAGKSDKEIAKAVGRTEYTILTWRLKNGIYRKVRNARR